MPIQPDPAPSSSPSADLRADAAVDRAATRRLKAFARAIPTLMAVCASVAAGAVWAESHMTATAKRYTDSQVDDLRNDVREVKTTLDDVKFFLGAPSRHPATQP